jgi:hypothetical protein
MSKLIVQRNVFVIPAIAWNSVAVIIEAVDIDLESRAFIGLDDVFNHRLIDLASMQIYADFVADLELS